MGNYTRPIPDRIETRETQAKPRAAIRYASSIDLELDLDLGNQSWSSPNNLFWLFYIDGKTGKPASYSHSHYSFRWPLTNGPTQIPISQPR